ncbi:MAG: hypothetical protein NTY15_03065 [Planctomycetota bacterium]|nr:hypothetical protein [Planctomycetota bacterium]
MSFARRNRRSAAILVTVLLTMLVVTSIVGTTMVLSLRSQRECRVERQMLQVQFLCEAGAIRVSEKLAAEPDFAGDRWLPELGDGSDSIAEIVTRIVRDPDQPLMIEVVASLEAGPYLQRVQRTRLFPFRIDTN